MAFSGDKALQILEGRLSRPVFHRHTLVVLVPNSVLDPFDIQSGFNVFTAPRTTTARLKTFCLGELSKDLK